MPPDFGMVTGLAGACTVIWLSGSSTVFSYKAPLSVTPPTKIMVSSAVQSLCGKLSWTKLTAGVFPAATNTGILRALQKSRKFSKIFVIRSISSFDLPGSCMPVRMVSYGLVQSEADN